MISRRSSTTATDTTAPRPISHRPVTPDIAVAARALTKEFDDQEVIKPLDLGVERGTILGLIGPSGCGKTTTVRLLTGLLDPTSGEASVMGRPSNQLTSAERARLGYLPQQPALFPDLSLAENLSFHASMYGLPFRRRQRLNQLLEWVELAEHRRKRVCDASGGMQRRLALAAAFVHDPEVVFLDEPTAGIDPILRDKLWQRFRETAEQGATLVVTTQYVGEAGQCDLVGLLSDGELLLMDTPENLRKAAFDGEVIDITTERPLRDDELAALSAESFVLGSAERIGTDGVRVVVDDVDGAVPAIRQVCERLGVAVTDVSEHIVDYDEAFVRVVERHRRGGDEPDAPHEAASEIPGADTDADTGADADTDTADDPNDRETEGVA